MNLKIEKYIENKFKKKNLKIFDSSDIHFCLTLAYL